MTPESHSSERSPRLVICCHGNKVYKIYACFLKSVNSYGVSLLSPKGGLGLSPFFLFAQMPTRTRCRCLGQK